MNESQKLARDKAMEAHVSVCAPNHYPNGSSFLAGYDLAFEQAEALEDFVQRMAISTLLENNTSTRWVGEKAREVLKAYRGEQV